MTLKDIDLKSCQVYAFDIFDTILSRKVHPEYIKKYGVVEQLNFMI